MKAGKKILIPAFEREGRHTNRNMQLFDTVPKDQNYFFRTPKMCVC